MIRPENFKIIQKKTLYDYVIGTIYSFQDEIYAFSADDRDKNIYLFKSNNQIKRIIWLNKFCVAINLSTFILFAFLAYSNSKLSYIYAFAKWLVAYASNYYIFTKIIIHGLKKEEKHEFPQGIDFEELSKSKNEPETYNQVEQTQNVVIPAIQVGAQTSSTLHEATSAIGNNIEAEKNTKTTEEQWNHQQEKRLLHQQQDELIEEIEDLPPIEIKKCLPKKKKVKKEKIKNIQSLEEDLDSPKRNEKKRPEKRYDPFSISAIDEYLRDREITQDEIDEWYETLRQEGILDDRYNRVSSKGIRALTELKEKLLKKYNHDEDRQEINKLFDFKELREKEASDEAKKMKKEVVFAFSSPRSLAKFINQYNILPMLALLCLNDKRFKDIEYICELIYSYVEEHKLEFILVSSFIAESILSKKKRGLFDFMAYSMLASKIYKYRFEFQKQQIEEIKRKSRYSSCSRVPSTYDRTVFSNDGITFFVTTRNKWEFKVYRHDRQNRLIKEDVISFETKRDIVKSNEDTIKFINTKKLVDVTDVLLTEQFKVISR